MFWIKKAFGFPIQTKDVLANWGFSKGNGFQSQQPTIRNYKGDLGAVPLTINHGVLYHKIFFSKGEGTLYQLPERAKGGPFLPIIQWDPWVHNSSLLVMADLVLENPCLRGWFLFKYFLLRVSAHSSPLQFLNLQQSLVLSVRFFCFTALIPKPPSSLWLVTLSQPTRWIFLLTSINLQIKFLLILSRALWILAGRIVPCIT